jgi:NADH-quinone oxidoreductase subunit M
LIAATGVIFAAFYMLPMVQRTAFNALTKPANRSIPDLNWREIGILVPLVLIILWLGVYPQPVLERTEPTVTRIIQQVQTSRLAADAGDSGALAAAQSAAGR